MKNIIKINGIEYIKLSKFKEVEKKKKVIKIKKEIKEVEKVVEKERDLQEYVILDPANVCCIYPLRKGCGEFEELETTLCFFKKVEDLNVTARFNKRWNVEVMKINGSKYSKEYFDNIKKIASVWFSNEPEVFMSYDKESKKFLDDEPIMFVFDWTIAFILAPRVEGDEE